MSLVPLLRAAAAVLALTGVLAPAWAQGLPAAGPPFILVEGQALAEVTPDIAQLSLGVVADRPSAGAATAEVARAAQAVVAQVKAEGIDDADVVTTTVTLTPLDADELSGRPGAGRAPKSFRASTDLLVTVRPAGRAGEVAAHLVDKGVNTIGGIAYSSSREQAILDGLRTDAMHDARRKAQIYVEALGARLGRVLEISPSTGGGGFQVQGAIRTKSILAAPSVPIPVEPGALPMRVDVGVRWEVLQ